jgi:filamentous hemagglutinin family protein
MKASPYLATSIATLIFTLGGSRAMALPTGEAVARGKADFKRDGGRMQIRASDRAVINFRGFNIDRNEAVTFVQPGAKSRVLNRVTDGNPTQIFGRLKANGQVVLVNPSGVFFQSGAVLNVGGMIAAAGKISDEDFVAGRNRFTELSGEVHNAGVIRATGDVSLVGRHVSNSGIIRSSRGLVSMVAGDEVLVGERGGNVFVSTGNGSKQGGTLKAGVSNTGKIAARKVLLGAGDLYAMAVQHSGEIRAEDVALRGGKGGRVEVSGRIDASARGKGRKGGRIEVTGGTVALTGAKLDASGDLGGGEVLVGGDWQGKGAVNRAQTTTVDAATLIHADALKHGAGGKVVVWADGATQFDGRISARGLGAGQPGGQVETSGKLTLGVGKTAQVDTLSPGGRAGDWLLDPNDLTIRADGTGSTTGSGDQVVAASVINTAKSNVTLQADQDITFDQAVSIAQSGVSLTAAAGRHLVVNKPISTNAGAISLTADADRNGSGALSLNTGGNLSSKGREITLTVDHGSAASGDGITINANIDTVNAAVQPIGANALVQLLGENQTGSIAVGRLNFNGGQTTTSGRGSYGRMTLKADEINLGGGDNSVTGTGGLSFEQANTGKGFILGAGDNSDANALEITRSELRALSSSPADGTSSWMGLSFGRNDSTARMVVGAASGADSADLTLGRGVGGATELKLLSGSMGFLGHVKLNAPGTQSVDIRGNAMSWDKGVVAPAGTLSILQFGNTPLEVVDTKKLGFVPTAGTLQLHTAMLKIMGDGSRNLILGDAATSRGTNLTVTDGFDLASVGTVGTLTLATGGAMVFEKGINAGIKGVTLQAGTLEFRNTSVSELKSAHKDADIRIETSNSSEGIACKRNIEIYATSPASTPDDLIDGVLTLKASDLHTLAGNFSRHMIVGSGGLQLGGDIVVNAPLNMAGRKISSLTLQAPESLRINELIKMGARETSTTIHQTLTLQGREIDIAAVSGAVSGSGQLFIQPVNNAAQANSADYGNLNPIQRGMVIGVAAQDAGRMTITADEYSRIGNGFSRIFLGRTDMTGDLQIKDTAFVLKADTDLLANSTIKIDVSTGGTSAADGNKKMLWARGLEVDITADVHDIATFGVSFTNNAISSGGKILVNRNAGSSSKPPGKVMDLNSADLARVKDSVDLLAIGYYQESNFASIEVADSWVLPTHTELRSVNKVASVAGDPPDSYGSIAVKNAISGNGKDLTFVSDSRLSLEGGPGSISGVRAMGITTTRAGIPIRLLDPVSDPAALVVSPASYAALGSGIQSLTVGWAVSVGGNGDADVTVAGPMTLVADTTLVTKTGNVSLQGPVNGGKALSLETQRFTHIAASLGATSPLASLTVSGSPSDPAVGRTIIGTGGGLPLKIRTVGNQTYGDWIELTSGGTLEAGGTLTVSKTLAAGANDLALFANEMLLNGGSNSVTGTGALTLGTGTPGTNMTFFGTTSVPGQLDLTQNKLQAVALAGFNKLTLGRTDGTGTLSVKENYALLQETMIQTGGGSLNIEGRIDGAQKLTLSSGSGTITASTHLGATTALGDLRVLSTGAATFQGAVNAATVFTDAGGSTALNGGTVTSAGLQDYNDQIVLGANTTLTSSGAGDVNLNAGAAGPFALNVNTSGVTRLRSAINVGSVETNVGGTVELASTITTTGTQKYHELAVLTGNTQLTGASVTFDEALGGGGFDLGVTGDAEFKKAVASLSGLAVSEDAVFGGAVGGAGALAVGSVTVGGATRINGGAVTTTGAQSYTGAVTLGGDAALTGSTVSFGDTVAGGGANLGVTGNAEFNGPATGLSSLGVTGTTLLNTTGVTTTGAQTYGGRVTLSQDTVLASTAGGRVAFNGGATGDRALTINTAGVTELDGGITVGSITTDAGGTVRLSGDIATTGAQTYGEQAQLLGNTTLTGTTVSFASTLQGGSNSLAVTGNAAFNGAATGLDTLSVSGTTAINGGTVTTSGAQTYTGAVTLGGDAALTGSTVSFGDTVAGGGANLGVTGNAEFNGPATGLSSLGVTGTTLLNTTGVTTTGAQTYGGRVTLGQDTVLASTAGGRIAFNGGATGNRALTINTAGVTELDGGITVGSITTDAGGTVRLSGDIATTGAQTYGEQAQLIGNTTLTGTTVSFASTLQGGTNSLRVAGNAAFNGATTGLDTLSVSGTTAINGGTVTTSGAQTYTGAVTLGGDAVLTGSTVSFGDTVAGGGANLGVTGNAEFNGPVTGLSSLGVTGTTLLNTVGVTTSGAQTYGGRVTLAQDTVLASTAGGRIALNGGATGDRALTINTAGVTELDGGITVGSITTDAGGSVKLSGAITTTGAQNYHDAAELAGPTTLASTGGGALALNAGAVGPFDLALNTSGATQLAGGIHLASLTTDAGGSTRITGNLTTVGAQTYGDAVQVVGPVALASSGGGALTLRAGVDGAGSVSLATGGDVTVIGNSGTGGALQDFTATGARVELGGVRASGDLIADAGDLLVLQGADYKAGNKIALNPTARALASGRSSIVKPNGGVTFEADQFVMGVGQKLVVSNGALSINAASGVVGDLAASVSMNLAVDQLQVHARAAGDFTNAGLKDLGLSIVSPTITFNGALSYSAESTGATKVFWNTSSGAVAGKNNMKTVPGSGVGKNPRMSEQFNSVDAAGYVLQPLAVQPTGVIPPVIVDPVAPVPPPLLPVPPVEPNPAPVAFTRPVAFDLVNWNLGYREETMERPDGIWVIRSLGINGRWDNLGRILSGQQSEPRRFLEL